MQLMAGDLRDVDKFHICARGKATSEFRCVSMFMRKLQKLQQSWKYQKIVCPNRPLEYMFS